MGKQKLQKNIYDYARFVLEDDNDVMSCALSDKDFNKTDKHLNRLLIKRHNKIIEKLDNKKPLTKMDRQLIDDANQIHVNDTMNFNGFHKKAMKLDKWLKTFKERTSK